jgi:hypothetical protein
MPRPALKAHSQNDPDGPLTSGEAAELRKLESRIQEAKRSFVVLGNALATIRDQRLYRATHGTFEGYCEQRWQIARRTAYQFIDAAKAVENVRHGAQTIPILPANERQARCLAAVEDPDQQREVWAKVVETAPGGKITAKHVGEVVRQSQGKTEVPAEPVRWTIDDAVERLGAKIYEFTQHWPEDHLAILAGQLRSLAAELEEFGEVRP